MRFNILWPKPPTADDIEFANSVYTQTPEFSTNGAALNWAIVTGKSEPYHSNASLFVLTRNEERVGVASCVEFDGFMLIENFVILPEVNGWGVATIFNEEIVQKRRLHLIHHCHTAVAIPTESSVYSVGKVGFVRAKSQAQWLEPRSPPLASVI